MKGFVQAHQIERIGSHAVTEHGPHGPSENALKALGRRDCLGLTLGLPVILRNSNFAVSKRFQSPPRNAGFREEKGMQKVAAHPR
jgi:hypothetical protein